MMKAGMCCWTGDYSNGYFTDAKIYFDSTSNNYHLGFGSDIPDFDGMYCNVRN